MNSTLPLVLVACGAEGGTPPSSESGRSRQSLVAVAYEVEIDSEGGVVVVTVDVVSDGDRVRSETDYREPDSFDPAVSVWDGRRLYSYQPESSAEKHVLYEAPDERLDALTSVQVLAARVGGERFARFCPDARGLGERRTIARRSAVGYRCGPGRIREAFSTSEAWFDEDTGVLLQAGAFNATRVTIDPKVDGETFSTEPPAGVEVMVHRPMESSYGQKAPVFALHPAAGTAGEGGGPVRLSDYQGAPVVLVPFSSDLYFGPGHECPDCFPSLVRLLEMTDGGRNPNVLAVQSGKVERAGRPPASPGVDLILLDDPGSTIVAEYGLSLGHQMAFVFIDGDGLIRHIIDHQATREDFQAGLRSIR